MSQTWSAVKGYVMGALAFIACPCHLPITLPLLVAVTAGTAFSAWLQNNFLTVGGASTVIFVGALVLALKWSGRPARVPARGRLAPAEVVLVVSSTCTSCAEADELWSGLRDRSGFRYRKVDINSGKGRSLAAKHNIFSTPTTLINGDVAFRGVPNRLQARVAVRR